MPLNTKELAAIDNLTSYLLWNDRWKNDRPIYDFQGETITRRQLQEDVCQKAAALRKRVSPGNTVLLCLNDSPSLVSLFLACIAVGAVPAIINPRCRDLTLQNLLEHSDAKLVFLPADRAAQLLVPNDIALCVDPDADTQAFASFGLNGAANLFLAPEDFYPASMDECCYLQYTSGSTGTPKAVTHTIATTLGFCEATTGYLSAFLARAGSEEQDSPSVRSYSVARMFFGYGMGNSLFFPLYAGWQARIHTEWPSIEQVASVLTEFSPAIFFATPTIYAHLKPYAERLSRLALAISAGAPLPQAEYKFWHARGLMIRDGLGATEMGHIFLAQPYKLSAYSCAGLPLSGYDCELRDQHGKVIDDHHCEGVLYVRGPSMSPCYLGNPTATAERFAGGWYNTGDRCIRDEQGYYHYQSRNDDLFKVKGRWVTPTAVEQRLMAQFSVVTEAALVASDTQTDEFNPTLFIVLSPDAALDSASLVSWLKASCESPMVPRHIEVVSALPRNDNGKLSRRDLQQQACALLQKSLAEALV